MDKHKSFTCAVWVHLPVPACSPSTPTQAARTHTGDLRLVCRSLIGRFLVSNTLWELQGFSGEGERRPSGLMSGVLPALRATMKPVGVAGSFLVTPTGGGANEGRGLKGIPVGEKGGIVRSEKGN